MGALGWSRDADCGACPGVARSTLRFYLGWLRLRRVVRALRVGAIRDGQHANKASYSANMLIGGLVRGPGFAVVACLPAFHLVGRRYTVGDVGLLVAVTR